MEKQPYRNRGASRSYFSLSLLRLTLISTTLLFAAGCASVKIQKLNADGTAVVGPEGMRFYMPRPYVSVFEPFVVDSKAYLVAGRLTSDRQFVWISSVPTELSGRFAAAPTGQGAPVLVPLSQVGIPPSGNGALQADVSSNLLATATNELAQTNGPSKPTASKPQEKAGSQRMSKKRRVGVIAKA